MSEGKVRVKDQPVLFTKDGVQRLGFARRELPDHRFEIMFMEVWSTVIREEEDLEPVFEVLGEQPVELFAQIKMLSREVSRLQNEIAVLKGLKGPK